MKDIREWIAGRFHDENMVITALCLFIIMLMIALYTIEMRHARIIKDIKENRANYRNMMIEQTAINLTIYYKE